MNKNQEKLQRRASRIRYHLKATAGDKARLTVFRSGTNIYAQIIDDKKGLTLVSASTVDKKLRKSIKKAATVEAATMVGAELAKRASAAGVADVYFDRSGYRYHGRIKALADAAREAGLKF